LRNKLILLAVIFLAILSFFVGYKLWEITPGDTVEDPGYAPTQPIPYSHKLHAGEMKIPCEFCHTAARRSQVAGVPPVSTCMGCHKFVAVDKPAIRWLKSKHDKNEPVEWIRVHDLPDFVRWSHQPHIIAGVACEDCHGSVESMDVVAQHKTLKMNWCVECHNKKVPDKACLKLNQNVDISSNRDKVCSPKNQASIACLACHY